MIDPLVRWLLAEGPKLPDLQALVAGLARGLVAEGIPVDRVWLSLMHHHPLMAAEAATWYADCDVRVTVMGHVRFNAIDRLSEGPMSAAQTHGHGRARLEGEPVGAYGLTPELWERGCTEVAIVVARWSVFRSGCMFTVATTRPEGFSDAEFARLIELRDPVGLLMRARHQEAMSATLAVTYLGRDVGARVLAGQIRRGDGETVAAAVWFSDLRGFTALSDRLSLQDLLSLLDDAFEAQVTAIEAHGGEVLKFIGDGLLAVFRAGERPPERACADALAASRAFAEALATVNGAREARGAVPIAYGLALHYGDGM